MRSLYSWSGVTALALLLATTVSLTFGAGQWFIIALSIGVGFGSAFGMAIAVAVHSSDRRKDRQMIERLIYEHTQPQIVRVPDPLVVEALGRVTENAVVGGFCCYCGSEHEGLEAEPYQAAFHALSPLCCIPYARRVYEAAAGDNTSQATKQIEQSQNLLEPTKNGNSKTSSRYAG